MTPRCAFDGCQAGGDILPNAPRVSVIVPHPDGLGVEDYHPGCWAATAGAEAPR